MAEKYVHENHAFESGEEKLDSTLQRNRKLSKEPTKDEVISNGLKEDVPEIIKKSIDEGEGDIVYGIEDSPPWYLCVLLGMQHYMTMIGSTLAIPFILTPLLCIADDDPIRGIFISSIIFVSGIATLIQTTFGVRLPIVQGGTFGFLVPTIAILVTSYPSCDQYNFSNMTSEERSEVWHVRIREIQGDIMVASLFQVLIGFTGIIGFLLTWITPLVIAPSISLIGLSLFSTAAKKAEGSWGIAIMTISLLIMFSQYMSEINVPIPSYSKAKGFRFLPFKIFKLFPVLLALALSWIICMLLTVTDAFPMEYPARTDLRTGIVANSPWFYVPYPFQWGLPTVTVAGIFGMLAGVLSSMIESVGDYYACARLAGGPSPPKHAINRGIGMEGIGCLIAGIIGTGNGTTSYSENIGAIRVTKVGSRPVVQVGALIMITFGVFGKFGGFFTTLPDPVIGGLLMVMFSLITAVGLSNLQFVNLNSSRNLFVLGFSLFFGLSLPNWLQSNSGAISTGSTAIDQIFTVLLSTPMFVGGFLGLVLDNTIPGTEEERGLDKWRALLLVKELDGEGVKKGSVYDFPPRIQTLFHRWSWCNRVPISPTYTSVMTSNENSLPLTTKLRSLLQRPRTNNAPRTASQP